MATYVKGNPVENATSYELFEKIGSAYNSLKTGSEINFKLDELGLSGGNHTLVVKAKADGYEDSGYSNEVTYVIPGGSVAIEWEHGSLDGTSGEENGDSDIYLRTDGFIECSQMTLTVPAEMKCYVMKYDNNSSFLTYEVNEGETSTHTGLQKVRLVLKYDDGRTTTLSDSEKITIVI